jgi:glycerol-3-phosphate acyltransferase PlsY
MPLSFGSLSAIMACALLSYLAGSIPFGLILTKTMGYGDIRIMGSGNIGATNVLRTGNKKLAFATLLCDLLKGLFPVLIAQRFDGEMAAAAMIFAPLGHIFPVWLNFKGGKGVATACGALLAYVWPAALAAVATWLIVAFLFRYSSLAALAATATAPLWTWLYADTNGPPLVVFFIALIVIWRHADNITRLLRGEEGKIAFKKKQA